MTWHDDQCQARHPLNERDCTCVLARHPYLQDPHSGAGNCWCGWWETALIHQVTPS